MFGLSLDRAVITRPALSVVARQCVLNHFLLLSNRMPKYFKGEPSSTAFELSTASRSPSLLKYPAIDASTAFALFCNTSFMFPPVTIIVSSAYLVMMIFLGSGRQITESYPANTSPSLRKCGALASIEHRGTLPYRRGHQIVEVTAS